MARPREREQTPVEIRLQMICDEHGFASVEELAAEAGASPPALRKAGQRNSLSKDLAKSLSDRFGLPIGWLMTGENGLKLGSELEKATRGKMTPAPDSIRVDGQEFVPIRRYDAALSAGPGSINDPSAEPIGYHLVESQWVRTLTSAIADNLAVLRVDGDSMEPTLDDGDWVLIDRTQTRINRPGVYAIQVGDTAWVKRITLNLRDRLVQVISDNSVYPIQELNEEELSVIGRVIWIVGRKI